MLGLASEEIQHFRQVLDLLEGRGLELGAPRPDRYVKELRQRFCSEGVGLGGVGDVLLVGAFVEARSCERFRLLAQALAERAGSDDDRNLGRFYARLAEAEGRHWELFRFLAETVRPKEEVQRRLDEVAVMEAEVVAGLPREARMH